VLLKPRLSPPLVVLTGGVSRSPRIRDHFRRFLARHGMTLAAAREEDLFLEALGAALAAAERPQPVPTLADLLEPRAAAHFDAIPPLADYLGKVRRMEALPPDAGGEGSLVLGYDIGSTGSKAVAVDAAGGGTVFQGYRSTSGDPVGAAQALTREFLKSPAGRRPVVALGATGSGREITGSLLASCYGADAVFVLNEIAAHARGALAYDARVDTIFEIGGQDAKYIRLSEGRVVDAAMNEACSAGTGSFIEEQGRRFPGIRDVAELGQAALAARTGVSLGQHCSVFMAEVLDEAVAAGVAADALIAGIYDSVVLNFLNRVKGSRDVGRVVFCQGMPASAPALAAAVACHTGREVVVPPNPGTVGALGIALLARDELDTNGRPALDLRRLLQARVEAKDAFVCRATRGCGGAGNRCRIERLRTVIDGRPKRFTWGGACSLYDRGLRQRPLPERAPDPFREREELVAGITRQMTRPQGGPRVALTDEFVLKGLFPFFVSFLHELGCDPLVRTGGGRDALKRGIEESSVPFCAPLQLHHGVVSALAEERPDFVFLPMLRALPRAGPEQHAVSCPLAQAAPDLLRLDLGAASPAVLSPVIDVGPGNLGSAAFARSCARIGRALGQSRRFRKAYEAALETQSGFDAACLERGREALAFCAERGVVPVVVMGRPYTIHSPILNSNVPAILREQGALPIPVDCYPVGGDVQPLLQQLLLRARQLHAPLLRACHDRQALRGH
jgi:predicted CoA-substrate-specific enzyme activase